MFNSEELRGDFVPFRLDKVPQVVQVALLGVFLMICWRNGRNTL